MTKVNYTSPKQKVENRIRELKEQIEKLKNETSYRIDPTKIESYEDTLKVNEKLLKIITGK